jgi:hypothetical protein
MTDSPALHPAASQLLRSATEDLTSDADLVRGGIARGRARRRRRRVGTSLAAAAVVGVIGVAASVGPGMVGDGGMALDPAAGGGAASVTPSGPPTTEVSVEPLEIRRLAVEQSEVAATFGRIVPGDVTELPQKEVDDDAPIVDLLWEGTAVRVGITPDDYVSGESAGTPQERCAIADEGEPAPGECRRLADGTVVLGTTSTGPGQDGGVTVNTAQAFTPDGWDVLVWNANAADTKDAPVLDDVPPLSVEQLLEVATSDVWFSGS